MAVSRAGYYRFVGKVAEDPDMELRSQVQKIALQMPRYGHRRVQGESNTKIFITGYSFLSLGLETPLTG
jgi:hypothetical protein